MLMKSLRYTVAAATMTLLSGGAFAALRCVGAAGGRAISGVLPGEVSDLRVLKHVVVGPGLRRDDELK